MLCTYLFVFMYIMPVIPYLKILFINLINPLSNYLTKKIIQYIDKLC